LARSGGALLLPREPAAARAAVLDARLRDALLVVELGDALDPAVLDALAEPALAVAVIARPGHPAIPALTARGLAPVEVARAGTAVQVEAWHAALEGRVERASLAELVRGHGLELGQLERAAAQVTAEVAPDAAPAVSLAAVERAARAVTSQRLAEIADRLSTTMTWDDLVLPDEVRAQIDDFWRAAAARRTVFEQWGFAAKVPYGRAISALFAGVPGTGKTMVATLVARELGLELYRVDLSRMVDKYVGETEKHLARLFEEAERGRCVILFDEADALFGKRSKGSESANDRYANLEINYLLQRIETFAGICILTTNQEAAMDDAFKRRLRYRIEFPFPETEERIEMWRRMIPPEAPRAPDVDVATLADRFAIAGGHIKNAILRAAFAAAAAGGVLDQAGLVRAATQEMEHIGKVVRH
ncbi:MAG: ATP-binding protein, partial [Deltaproteobacteria bacterium]|nr:ATP-binding protein [Deltaproteobacteria bacterium]